VTALRSGSATDVGRVRTSNQDVALEDPDLFAVADGMGGHVGGEVAARVAVDALRASFQRHPSVEGLRRAVAEANRAVWRQSQAESGLRGMGTTLTATALVREPDGREVVALANVGDSRAYVYSKGEVIQVTADHSLAEEKVRQGQLTEEEAAVHPHRHILTRALGVSSDVDVDLWELHLKEGDRILLCSDGLTNEVDDDRIGGILATAADPRDAARALVRAAVDHGGSDNVTAVVVDVVGEGAGGTAGAEGAQAGGSDAGRDAGGGSDAGGGPAGRGPFGAAEGEPLGAAAAGATRTSGGRPRPGAPPPGDLLVADGTAPGGTARDATTGVGMTAHARGAGYGPAAPDEPAAAGAAVALGTLEGVRPGAIHGWPPPLPPRLLSRRERRRRRRMAGIPRLVTVRVVLFLVLFAAVVYAAYALVRWYAMDDWYVAVDNNHLAIYHGRPGGFLWFKPRLVDDTSVSISGILPVALSTVRADKEEPSAAAARRYVTNLHQEFLATQQLGVGVTPASTSTSSATTAPSTTAGGTSGTAAGGASGPASGSGSASGG
jgi:serine/threonine protein phosphatase PrpC